MRWLPLLAALGLLVLVIDLVRRRRLREEFSWSWVLGALAALVLGLSSSARAALAGVFGVDERSAILAAGLLFLALVALDISTKVSKLANHQKNLAQNLGRLEKRLADLESDAGGPRE